MLNFIETIKTKIDLAPEAYRLNIEAGFIYVQESSKIDLISKLNEASILGELDVDIIHDIINRIVRHMAKEIGILFHPDTGLKDIVERLKLLGDLDWSLYNDDEESDESSLAKMFALHTGEEPLAEFFRLEDCTEFMMKYDNTLEALDLEEVEMEQSIIMNMMHYVKISDREMPEYFKGKREIDFMNLTTFRQDLDIDFNDVGEVVDSIFLMNIWSSEYPEVTVDNGVEILQTIAGRIPPENVSKVNVDLREMYATWDNTKGLFK